MASASGHSSGGEIKKSHPTNRLASEKSSYLLQHANNPVDWYPWGEAALQKAKDENKPIFLSIGYSTCHWCHVMEKESFESEEVAEILNASFINIKVDREERPDIDKVYMTYVQATTGSGGWPLSLWLTPKLAPIYGGTYFPPHDKYGRPGFTTVIQAIHQKWEEQKDTLQESGEAVMGILANEIKIPVGENDVMPGLDAAQKCFQGFSKQYDPLYGGFSKAPKFPQAVIFNFLLRFYYLHHATMPNHLAKEMCLHTLKLMGRGGIHDHIAKGFHRYSTDNEWHVPHFEKMLYDQAQLAYVYSEAYQLSKIKLYADVAHGILLYVTRDLGDEQGGFYSAEDADSYPTADAEKKVEGAFCVWTHKEIVKLLNSPLIGNSKHKLHQVFCYYYGIKEDGNVEPYQDPHDELKHKNVLIIRTEKEKVADEFGISLDQLRENLMQGCRILFEARLNRPRPHLDNKIIAAWNGLMISGLAKAGMIFSEVKYVDRAIKAAEFIKKHMYLPDTKILLRSCYPAEQTSSVEQGNRIEGFSDDYAFMIRALLDLYEACGNSRWLEWAAELQVQQDELFWDYEAKGYFLTNGKDPSIILRMKDDQDGAEPSSNSVAVMNLLRLSLFLDEPRYWNQAASLLISFNERIRKVPFAVPHMICGLLFYHKQVKRIVLAGDLESDGLKALMQVVNSVYLPNKVIMYADGDPNNFLYKKVSLFPRLTPKDGKATAYVCEGNTCSLPITSPEALEQLLNTTKKV